RSHAPVTPASGYIYLGLRYPGQFAEIGGANYNYFRDYEAGTGRYTQSDPIGLWGGVGSYGYVSGMPLALVDLWGLVEGSPGNMARRAEIDRLARSYDGSGAWRLDVTKDDFGVGTNKCNQFVNDVADEAGAPLRVQLRN